MNINVLVAHSVPLIQAGVVAILAAQDGIRIMPPLSAGANVAVTDFEAFMAAADGWSCPVILIMPHAGERDVRAAAQNGAKGYMTQTCAAAELIQAVRTLADGRSYFDGAAAHTLTELLRPCNLTARERDVLLLLAEGSSNKAIARSLGIGCGTVKSHLKSLLHKLDADCRTQAVVVAVQRGLVLTEPRSESVRRPSSRGHLEV